MNQTEHKPLESQDVSEHGHWTHQCCPCPLAFCLCQKQAAGATLIITRRPGLNPLHKGRRCGLTGSVAVYNTELASLETGCKGL